MICRLRGEESWESIRFIDRDSIQVPEVWINDAGLFTDPDRVAARARAVFAVRGVEV